MTTTRNAVIMQHNQGDNMSPFIQNLIVMENRKYKKVSNSELFYIVVLFGLIKCMRCVFRVVFESFCGIIFIGKVCKVLNP